MLQKNSLETHLETSSKNVEIFSKSLIHKALQEINIFYNQMFVPMFPDCFGSEECQVGGRSSAQ